MLARRFSLPPVQEAMYEPRQIPNAHRELEGTVLLSPPREVWLTLLGEMVQMVNEAVRRRATTARDASKPLSLEYMGDRLDIDDPLRGYLAVTEKEGWMQGFVTATTFTTWHRNFMWDSTNPTLELVHTPDDEELAKAKASGKKPWVPRVDEGGILSTELQAELHAGDPDNEGVVWPRIAELSLLGALGCGRALVELVIEELEAEDSPYSYIVTQATDGSKTFYERMGFVRVGACTWKKVEEGEAGSGKGGSGKGGKGGKGSGAGGGSSSGTGSGKKRKANAPPPKSQWTASHHFEHRTEDGETTVDAYAARFGVPVFDLIFLNQSRFPKLHAGSIVRKDVKLRIPQPASLEQVRSEVAAKHACWFVVPEDMGFKAVAEKVGVEPKELLKLNQGRPELKGIGLSAELLAGTMLQVGPIEYDCDEYSHWSFPDDNPALAEPSYMMARRLKPKAERTAASAGAAFARYAPLRRAERPPIQPGGKRASFIQAIEDAKAEEARRKQAWADSAWHIVKEDILFKKEAEGLGIDARELRDMNAARLKGLQLSSFLKKDTWLQIKPLDEMPAFEEAKRAEQHLTNRVVQIDGEDDYEFWYVLTYLPDLQWCHVAPLERRGVFTDAPNPTGHVAEGRDRWMLVSEEEGGEIDVGAGRCHVMEALEMKGTKANADTEEWDIIGRAPPGWLGPPSVQRAPKVKKTKAASEPGAAAPPGDGVAPAAGGVEGGGPVLEAAPVASLPANEDGAAAAGDGASSQLAALDGEAAAQQAAAAEARARAEAEKAARAEARARAAAEKAAQQAAQQALRAKADAEKAELAALNSLKNVVRMIGRQKHADIFLDPVDWEALEIPDYPEIVSTPMDLGTVQQKLDAGGYTSVVDVAADVGLVWSNAMLYNPPDDAVYQAAVAVKEFADRKLEPFVAAAKARASLLAPPPPSTS